MSDVPEETKTANLPPAAQRALEEARLRRDAQRLPDVIQGERDGPKGSEPTRYGDWERKGIAYDF
jgi:hypothetical protein